MVWIRDNCTDRLKVRLSGYEFPRTRLSLSLSLSLCLSLHVCLGVSFSSGIKNENLVKKKS